MAIFNAKRACDTSAAANGKGHLSNLKSKNITQRNVIFSQFNTSFYPTEYRVEIFSPPYMAATPRPTIITAPAEITFNSLFKIEAALQGQAIHGDVQVNLLAQGFHTHGQGMSQRMVQMGWQVISGTLGLEVNAPRDASVIPPG